jgi:hypothetical protein
MDKFRNTDNVLKSLMEHRLTFRLKNTVFIVRTFDIAL